MIFPAQAPAQLHSIHAREHEIEHEEVWRRAVQLLERIEQDAVVARVGALRQAMGPDFGIAVDFHGRVHRPMARQLAKELDPFHLMFLEEPVLSEHLVRLALEAPAGTLHWPTSAPLQPQASTLPSLCFGPSA